MIDIDLSIADLVRTIYSDCFDRDMDRKERFDPRDPERYIAPFEVYREDYSPLEQLGIRIVDPKKIGYSLGRNGDCTDLTLHMARWLHYPEDSGKFIDVILGLPEIETSTDGCLVVYYSALPEALRIIGTPTHLGLFTNGKVLSKWGSSPIFEHEISAMPYTDTMRINGREFPQDHWVLFKSYLFL